MSEGSESEVRGIHALGNPDVEYRSAQGGQTGENPIGGRLPSGILATGMPKPGIRAGMRGMPDGKEQLRKSSSR